MNRDTQSDLYGQATGWLMKTAQRNPEGLLLLAAGAALLLRSGSSRSQSGTTGNASTSSSSYSADRGRDTLSRAASEASNYASGIKDEASNYAADIRDKVSGTVSDYAQSVSDYASETGRAVSERSQEFARQAQSTVESTMGRVLRDQPLAVAMVGLAAGAAVAAAFPATEIEKRTLGLAGEAMADAAEKAKDSVMEAAGKAGERLKSAAQERGLTADGLKDLAGEVTDAFKDSMAGKAKDQGSPPKDQSSPTMVPAPGPSGLASKPSSPADRGAGVRTADIAGGGTTRGGGSNR
jgi:hypothetical protein